jgi:transitional endoplasmic reticulum ATPase
MKPQIKLWPFGDPQQVGDFEILHNDATLAQLLAAHPCYSLSAVSDEHLRTPLRLLSLVLLDEVDRQTPLYLPKGVSPVLASADASGSESSSKPDSMPPASGSSQPAIGTTAPKRDHPESVSEAEAVVLAYKEEIKEIAIFLEAGLSVLVYCDTIIIPHLYPAIVRGAGLEPEVLSVPPSTSKNPLFVQSQRQSELARLRELLTELKVGQVLVLPHLDLLGGGGDRGMSGEARELTELLYGASDRLLLAFADRSLPLPEVIAARFAVRPTIAGLPREIPTTDGHPVPIGVALVTREEASWFRGFSPTELLKNVAGLNPVRLRHALTYAVGYARREGHRVADNPADVGLLHRSIRAFKAQTSEAFEVPDVTMEQIGGYDEVKQQLGRALQIMAGQWNLPDERIRRELIPRGFLLYGPPGTGKTLFAKAVANTLNATIRVVSGPEVTDMYVGESERKVREIFAEARRNAPAVIVFDEFDSIAGKRSGRDDGGSRANNALVAQILTEMDGFRPDVPMLVIGTTNRLELIDEALLRPSRFQAISVWLPEADARRAIAEIHARHFQLEFEPEEREALLTMVAQATHGLNGDEIRSLFRDACVDLHCRQPPIPLTAKRLGYLVGRLRQRDDSQRFERIRSADTNRARRAATDPRASARPGPIPEMMTPMIGAQVHDQGEEQT